jgi:hypothetical protein
MFTSKMYNKIKSNERRQIMNRKTKIALATSLAAAVAVVALLWTFYNVGTARALAASQAPAQLAAQPVAPSIRYQGRLTDSSGLPVDGGVYTMTFSIYDVSSGGIALWTQTSTVTVTNGLFDVALGDVSNPIDSAVFPGGPRWLGVQVDPDPEMTPRQPFDSIPYAVMAENLRSGGMTSDTSSGALYTFTNNGSGPALVINGDARVNGNLSWYTRTGYISVSPAAFVPDDEAYQYDRDSGSGLKQDSASSGSLYYAAVSLPHGAVVTKFTIYYYDDSTGGTILARLRYSNLSTGSYAMAEALSADGGYGDTDDTSIDYAEVDNETRAYYVQVQFPSAPYSGTLNFKGVVIEYEYTEPY